MRFLLTFAICSLALGCDSEPQGSIPALPAGDPLAAPIADLKSSDPAKRKAAASALGDMGPQARPATERLIAALDDDDAAFREEAAWALAKIGSDDKLLVPVLIEKLQDESEETQGTAIIGLGRIGPDA